MEGKTCIRKLSELTDSIQYERLPQEVVEKAKISIMDALECCIDNMNDQRGHAAYASVPKDAPTARATIFDSGHKADAADAAYYNTIKGAITSRNDTSMVAMSHPGCLVIPTVLAVGEEVGASGKTILEAVVAGYEAMLRFGCLLFGRTNRAWRTTAIYGPVGAAFAAAKAAGLDAEQAASAGSFACHSCGGVNEWALSGTGEDVFQNAAAARNGIFAMRLAKGGAKGCPTIIEGEAGIAAAFGIHDGFELMWENIGEPWLIMKCINKPITSCIIVQNPCQTANAMIQAHPELRYEDISHVVVEVNKTHKEHFGCANNVHIENVVDAIMSIPLGVAGTLVNGSDAKLNFVPPYDPVVLELMHRVEVVEEKTFTETGRTGTRLHVFMKDGTEYVHEKEQLTPLTQEQVRARFHATCEAKLGKEKTKLVEQYINSLEELEDIRTLTALFC